MRFRSQGLTMEELLKEADAGNHGAQAELSLEYLIGEKIDRDISKSIRYMELASEDIYAINMCFKSAREKDIPAAYLAMAFQWDYGFGVPHSSKICVENLLIAVERNDPDAMHLLAYKYRFGFGIEEDCFKSEYWYLRALELGVTDSHFDLYLLYAKEEELLDHQKAWDHLQKAVNLKHPHPNAYLFMGEAYLEEKLTPLNKIEAAKWFLIARKENDFVSGELAILEKELSKEEWAKAESDALEWIIQHNTLEK